MTCPQSPVPSADMTAPRTPGVSTSTDSGSATRAPTARSIGRMDSDVRRSLADLARGRCQSRLFDRACRGAGESAHHRLPKARGGRLLDAVAAEIIRHRPLVADDVAHLAWVCEPCHRAIHAKPSDALRARLTISGYVHTDLGGNAVYVGSDELLRSLYPDRSNV